MPFYAHTLPERSEEEWEPLERHLEEVADLSAAFARAFDSAEWGYLGGLWHDLGKYHPRFQKRLRDATVRQPHSGAGAVLALGKHKLLGEFLASVIAAHHAGLYNRTDGMTLDQKARAPLVGKELLGRGPFCWTNGICKQTMRAYYLVYAGAAKYPDSLIWGNTCR